MKVVQHGTAAQATLYDGNLEYPSDSGAFDHGKLRLHWNIYNADLEATVDHGELTGTYVTRRSNTKLLHKDIVARRAVPVKAAGSIPNIAGDWTLKADDGDPKNVWTIRIKQSGANVSGAIQRLDGDSGTLTGTIQNGQIVMSHFAGIRPAVLRAELTTDGEMKIVFGVDQKMIGLRSEVARSRGIVPINPMQFTSVKNPSEPFPFAFPDIAGKMISNTDERFKGKVVLVNITGSWCPNCNDDAPFLEHLYKNYQRNGLEIVGLSFESGDIDYDRERVKQFIERNHVTYPVLIAGTTENIAEKLPLVQNFAGYPTTFFLGRDGLVKSIHDGFAGVGTGPAHEKLKGEIEERVQQLLSGREAVSEVR
jgi:thiol-disulfide isomerase/thioredoxin